MNERRQGEENTGTRGEPRALRPGELRALWREGGRGVPGAQASPPARLLLPLACPALLLRETFREESQPGLSTVPSAWALGSPRGCPPCPNQLGRRAGPSAASARTSIGWPLKAGVCPGSHPAPLREGAGPPAQGSPRRSLELEAG